MGNLEIDNMQLNDIVQNLIKSYNKEQKQYKNTEHLWDLAEQNILPMICSQCSIHIELKLNNNKIRCFLDTVKCLI